MPNADAESSRVEAVLQRVGTRAWNVAQPLVSRVDVLPEADRVQIRVKPTRRGHDHITGWHVMGFDKPGVAVAALYLQPV